MSYIYSTNSATAAKKADKNGQDSDGWVGWGRVCSGTPWKGICEQVNKRERRLSYRWTLKRAGWAECSPRCCPGSGPIAARWTWGAECRKAEREIAFCAPHMEWTGCNLGSNTTKNTNISTAGYQHVLCHSLSKGSADRSLAGKMYYLKMQKAASLKLPFLLQKAPAQKDLFIHTLMGNLQYAFLS